MTSVKHEGDHGRWEKGGEGAEKSRTRREELTCKNKKNRK